MAAATAEEAEDEDEAMDSGARSVQGVVRRVSRGTGESMRGRGKVVPSGGWERTSCLYETWSGDIRGMVRVPGYVADFGLICRGCFEWFSRR